MQIHESHRFPKLIASTDSQGRCAVRCMLCEAGYVASAASVDDEGYLRRKIVSVDEDLIEPCPGGALPGILAREGKQLPSTVYANPYE